MAFSPQKLLDVLQTLPVPEQYWVAFSGGMDSTVLLHGLATIRPELSAPLMAIHINHGLQVKALEWEMYCRETCARLDIPLTNLQLNLRPASGESLEAQARDARYTAIAARMNPQDMLLTAHHGDDQVETFLLQLLRGAGISGLASMPLIRDWQTGWLARPLLEYSREALLDWARKEELQWQDDPSNERLNIRRNYLRHKVIPLLKDQWPGLINTTARSARHCAEAAILMREVGTADMALVWDEGKPWQMMISGLEVLSLQRQKNLLRYWIRHQGLPVPGHRIIERILSEVMQAQQAGSPLLSWNSAEIRRYRGRLYLMPTLPEAPSEEVRLHWDGSRPLKLPEGLGRLLVRTGTDWLSEGVDVVFRSESLKCRPGKGKSNRSFKGLCQELSIPPWLRQRLPLIYRNDELIAVADYCMCQPEMGKSPFTWERPQWLQ
ncbi:tRNA lysidine(34) synthetase TilS [Thiolapillus sp.]|uniref:tRNA lysidine(34) synthetase TilS n=1 Tax=Thiolapillus sp. TaxID=2017437 RepID=UPI0025D32CE9